MSKIEFKMTYGGFSFREPEMTNYIRSPSGPVGEHLASKGRLITGLAKIQVGVRTGALRSSIHMRHLVDTRGQYVMVGSPLPYARMHHEGTKPHVITPKRAKMLRFVRRGQVVYAHSVLHPGTKANKYLVDAMKKVPGLSFS